ncbi:MAG: hypothetical protein MJA31_07495 [Clostridia bacterium]|nr:hypothetical protein [Clostridia bacterium]
MINGIHDVELTTKDISKIISIIEITISRLNDLILNLEFIIKKNNLYQDNVIYKALNQNKAEVAKLYVLKNKFENKLNFLNGTNDNIIEFK